MATIRHFVDYIEDKSHRRYLFWFFSLILVPLLVFFEIVSFLPPRVSAEEYQTIQPLDQPFVFKFFGSLDESSVKVMIEPKIDYELVWTQNWNPFESELKIIPKGLLRPNTSYTINVEVTNWLGQTQNSTYQSATPDLPRINSAAPKNGQEGVSPNVKIAFNLARQFERSRFLFHSEPSFEFDQHFEDGQLLIYPKNKLSQGQKYEISLLLDSATLPTQPLYLGTFTTISPLELVTSSPSNGQKTVLKTAGLSFSFNKAVRAESLQTTWRLEPETAGTFTWNDEKTLTFTPEKPLLTNTGYKVTLLSSLTALDNSQLNSDLSVNFNTAGPVQVVSISPSGTLVGLGSNVVVKFDQPVDKASAQKNFTISPDVSGSFSWRGSTMIFDPTSLGLLRSYTVSVSKGIESVGGEDSNKDFSASFTTTSERVRVIGYSVLGRPIYAYYFGVGAKKILLVGSLHGSESNTGNMLSSWVSYLRSNQGKIKSDRTFIIVPYANPDGTAIWARFNAHNVDLNRNWGTPDWQALTWLGYNSYPKGGGSGPFSEPETRALRDLINNERPKISITYHSAANLVLGDGVANYLGDWYASKTSYTRSHGGGDPDSCISALGYCITGTMEEWTTLQGRPIIVVEFITHYGSEYERNFPALLGLATSYPL